MPPTVPPHETYDTRLHAVPPVQREIRASADRRVITVCHPVWRLGCGGLEHQLIQTVGNLPCDGFRHVLVVRGRDDEGIARARALDSHIEIVEQAARKRDRLWPLRLASILQKRSVDVLHVRGMTMLLDSLLAARFCGNVALAFSFHGFEHAGSSIGRVRRFVYRAAIAGCDDRWAVSRVAADAIASELRMAPEQFGILPNGVDTRRFAPVVDKAEVRQRLGLPLDRTIILSVGNLKPIKGHDTLLEAMRTLQGATALCTLVLVGKDYSKGALQHQARAQLPDADIRFVGRRSDPLPWYQAADVFVLPSRWEGLSNALLEAMSCGLPVVATAVGGNKDVIDHGRTGLLAKPDCPGAFGAAIRHMLVDTDHRAALARAGWAHVRHRFAAPIAVHRHGCRYTKLARMNRCRGVEAQSTIGPRKNADGDTDDALHEHQAGHPSAAGDAAPIP